MKCGSTFDGAANWEVEKRQMEREHLKLVREISTLKKKCHVAQEQKALADHRSAENTHKAKSARNCLKVLEQDAHRFRWLKKIGCEEAIGVLKRWETDYWDHIIDKARGHIR